MANTISFLYVAFTILRQSYSDQILFVFHPIAKSHSMFMNYTAQALRKEGHNVSFIHIPLTEASEHIIPTSNPSVPYLVFNRTTDTRTKRMLQRTLDNLLWNKQMEMRETYKAIYTFAHSFSSICRLLETESVQDQLKQFKPDLMVIDATFVACIHRLPHMLNVPYIETVGISLIINQAQAQGCPFPPSYVTGQLLAIIRTSGFWDRVLNFLDLVSNLAAGLLLHMHSVKSLPNESFMFFSNMMTNISHYLVNDDPFLLPTRPYVPAIHLTEDSRVVALVTHGGINSVMEAAYHGVAFVGIPLYGDQAAVLLRAQHWTTAPIVRKDQLTVNKLTFAIKNSIHNKQLQKRINRLQSFVSDRILSASDTSKFWVKHTLKHRGNIWHKPKGIRLSFWTYYYCDLILLVGGSLTSFTISLSIACKLHAFKSFRRCFL